MRENMTSTLAKFIFAIGCMTCLFLSACENEDMNKMALGQQCLDDLDESSSSLESDAEKCLNYVKDVDHQQANIIKCSVKFIQGGLTTTRITNAYKEMDSDENTNKKAMFMSLLAFDTMTDATEAAQYCKDSDVSGLIYLANIAVIGTQLALTYENLGLGDFDPNTPPSDSEMQQMLDECQTDGSSNCDPAAVGTAVESIGESYCSTKEPDHEVCGDINQAIDESGGDSEALGQRFLELMEQSQ